MISKLLIFTTSTLLCPLSWFLWWFLQSPSFTSVRWHPSFFVIVSIWNKSWIQSLEFILYLSFVNNVDLWITSSIPTSSVAIVPSNVKASSLMFYHYQDIIYADTMFTQIHTDSVFSVQSHTTAAIYYQWTTITAYIVFASPWSHSTRLSVIWRHYDTFLNSCRHQPSCVPSWQMSLLFL